MNKIRVYNEYELEVLKKNPNVVKIKNNSQIQYSGNFKLWAVQEKLRHPEKTSRQIFESGGFDMNILDERTPQKRLCDWVKKYKKFGSNYFISNNKYTYKSVNKLLTRDRKYFLKIKDGQLFIYRVEDE